MKPNTNKSQLAIAILAAGKGKRMNNPNKAKVMFPLDGKPMIGYVVETANKLTPKLIVLIVGWKMESVIEYISTECSKKASSEIIFVEQKQQLGTGHAVLQIKTALGKFSGSILVLSGDVPLLSEKTLARLLEKHRQTKAVATILTAKLANPFGYGRIIHNSDRSVRKIVEEKDASPNEQEVNEINSGIYLFEKEQLFEALQHITPNNAQKEYYLTDVFQYFTDKKYKVSSLIADSPTEILGVNTVDDLANLEEMLHQATNE